MRGSSMPRQTPQQTRWQRFGGRGVRGTHPAARRTGEPTLPQKLAAEFVGTALLVLFGAGSVTATFTLVPSTKAPLTEADLGIISLAFAIIIAVVVYTVGRISGAHINPAVTIGLAVRGHISWFDSVWYIVAQLIGGLVGAFCIAVIFGGHAASGGILGVTTFNPAITSPWQAVAGEALGTFILEFTIYGLAVDPKAPPGWAGLLIGLVVGGAIMVLGPITGGSLNPARTFGPMFAQAWLGGPNFAGQFWVYIIGPIAGSVAAAFTYDLITTPRSGPTEVPMGPATTEPAETA